MSAQTRARFHVSVPGLEPAAGAAPEQPQVEIVVPVRNEERGLTAGVLRLHAFLREHFPFTARITVADNGSTDGTWDIATGLASRLAGVRAVRLAQPGRGRALAQVWGSSGASVLVYMDVDLSTDLNALLPMVAPVLSGHSDVAVGTRLSRNARVLRGPKRELISRCYNLLLHATLGTRFSDAQCGFKAISREAARQLLPLVQDTGWFFDTELLVLAERAGLRIYEVPVDWRDDPDSTVDIVATALADLRGILRIGIALALGKIPLPDRGQRRGRPSTGGQLARFVAVGVVSTLTYLLLYLGLREVLAAQPANALALVTTAVANTAANRRFTFGIRGRRHAVRHQWLGLAVFGAGLAVTSGALAALHEAAGRPSVAAEVTVLALANLMATGLRFVLYRGWVFRDRPPLPSARPPRPSAPSVRSFTPSRAAGPEPGSGPADAESGIAILRSTR